MPNFRTELLEIVVLELVGQAVAEVVYANRLVLIGMEACGIVVVRVLVGTELRLVASYPRPEDVGFDGAISKVTDVGRRGSGEAAKTKTPLYYPDETALRDKFRAVEFRPGTPEYRYALSLTSEAVVPLLVGDKLVGTMTLMSPFPAEHVVRKNGGVWESFEGGVQEHHKDLLVYHGHWLGPALEIISRLVERQQH